MIGHIMTGYIVPSGNASRPATDAEAIIAEAARMELDSLRRQREDLDFKIKAIEIACKHPVCTDEPGHPYTWRYCAACGKCIAVI